mgnify:CR=1 FL=1
MYNKFNGTYDEDVINYHIKFIYESNLVEKVSYASGFIPIRIWDLTPLGHQYAANIRDNTIWNKLKGTISKFASISLPILIQKSSEIFLNTIS